MKIFIINKENNDEKIEIQIDDNSTVENLENKLKDILYLNGKFMKYKLFHGNIILRGNNMINHYKLRENDEIEFGIIENYLKKDNAIVYVFNVLDDRCGGEYLVIKINDTISIIREIIERIHSEITNIWNIDGKEMKNYQNITEIDPNGDYKLIIRCDDKGGNKWCNTFDYCKYLYDILWVHQYFFDTPIFDDNKTESAKSKLINVMEEMKQIISSNDTMDDRLNQNLSDLPSPFLNSTIFFCIYMTKRIEDICKDYLEILMKKCDNDVLSSAIFDQYFHFAIRIALWDYSNSRKHNKNTSKWSIGSIVFNYFINFLNYFNNCCFHFKLHNKNKINKSVRSIIIDSLNYFMKYLIDSNNDWQYWLKLFISRHLLELPNDIDLNTRIDKWKARNFRIKTKINREDKHCFITFKPKTIIEAKHAISTIFKVNMKQLYCIMPDRKPNDEDSFDNEYIIEIVLSMNDIEILRSLGRGAFAKIYLCLDKKSNKQFALKKPIYTEEDINNDIYILSKFESSGNIINCFGLFIYKERICIGMEYMAGGSLSSYLNEKKKLSEHEIVKISYEILTQINELHKSGIIHRDIKPDNIVFDEHNKAKLIDFGESISALIESIISLDNSQPDILGTVYYMAPELIKEEQYTDKIDIWSFGMVIVEMMTGKKPFHWVKTISLPVQIIPKVRDCTNNMFEQICSISNELNQFVNSCLNIYPDERPSAEQLLKFKIIMDIKKY